MEPTIFFPDKKVDGWRDFFLSINSRIYSPDETYAIEFMPPQIKLCLNTSSRINTTMKYYIKNL